MKIKCLMCGELYEKGFFKRFFNCYKEGEGARFVWFIDICPKCEQYIDAKRQRKQLVKEKKTIIAELLLQQVFTMERELLNKSLLALMQFK